jgi:hypothetical protein
MSAIDQGVNQIGADEPGGAGDEASHAAVYFGLSATIQCKRGSSRKGAKLAKKEDTEFSPELPRLCGLCAFAGGPRLCNHATRKDSAGGSCLKENNPTQPYARK